MKKQTEYDNPKIRRYGCYFCVMCRFAEIVAGKELSDEAVEKIYRKAQETKGGNRKPAMDENCLLDDPQVIVNLALDELGQSRRIFQVGVETDGRRTFWAWYRPNAAVDFVAEEWKTENGSHFITEGYNPDPTIRLLRLKKKVFYKIF